MTQQTFRKNYIFVFFGKKILKVGNQRFAVCDEMNLVRVRGKNTHYDKQIAFRLARS